MPLINSFISWVMKKRIHQIELFMKYPQEVQTEWFKKLINSAKDTEWGRNYDYQSITTAEQFSQRVPIQDYETLKPYIERLRRGEQNILWPTDTKWFAKSSGTTDKSKFIPVSNESLEECHFKGGKDLLSIYFNNNPNSKLFTGKALAMGGSHQVCEFNNESFYGDVSAIIMQHLPFWVEFIRTPNLSIALMDKWEEKIDEMAKATIKDDVTNLSGVPSWTMVLLKRILEITGKSDIMEVWPNLELFIHGGVNFTPYKELYQQMIPSASMNYLGTYNASEGFFGIQDTTNSEDLLLMLDYGIYYEFIPINHIDELSPTAIGLDEVEIGKNYALVISTNAGLWRYMIGDTVMFTSIDPYRIIITGRTKSFINAFGEEFIVDNAEKALSVACEKTQSIVREYTVAPKYITDIESGAHEWFIEFEKAPENIDYFTEILDNAAKSVNSDYEAKRYHNLSLQLPIIRVVPQGTFYHWMKSKGKLGGQHKVRRLSNDREIAKEIQKVINELCVYQDM